MNRLITIRNLMLAGFTCLLAASCSEDDSDNRLPDGKYPMTFTAGVEGLTVTRASGKDEWMTNDQIAVSVDGGTNSKTYKITNASTGAMEPNTPDDPCYWQKNTGQQIRAWYPATPASNVDISDQSGGFASFDYLTANETANFTTAAVSLPFKHQMAKVKYILVKGEGITDDEFASATVQIYGYTTANFANGTLSGGYNGWITPHATSKEALLVPQQMEEDNKFIQVTISGYDYYYTPKNSTDANLAASNQYTYTITVNKTGLEVTVSDTNAPWTGEEEETVTGLIKGFTTNDLKIGDYYYSDGKTSDGGYRKYSDGTTTTLDIRPVLTDGGKERTVLGIVLKVGKDATGLWKDDCSYKLKGGTTDMTDIRGYVLALYDANGGNVCAWGPTDVSVETKTDKETGFYGYYNTQKIKEAAGTLTANNYPAAYYATEDYETREDNKYAAPTNSSGWFFPSAGQCWYWYQQKDVLLPSIKKATENGSYNWQDYYWSSSEHSSNPTDYARYVDFYYGGVNFDSKNYDYYFRVRSCLAF